MKGILGAVGAAFFVHFLACSASAQLNWDTRQVELTAAPSDEHVVAEFPFTNKGEKPITISSVTTSCDCTTAELDKKTYAPGERGSIKAKFTIGSRSGVEQKVITVKSDDAIKPTMTLMMKVNIPKIWEISPNYVYWDRQGAATTQEITLKIVATDPIKVLGATPIGKKLKVDLKEVLPGREYVLSLTPIATGMPFTEEVEVKLDLPNDRGRFRVHGMMSTMLKQPTPATRPAPSGS